MNVWHDMDPAQVKPGNFSAVIEIPKGSQCKYELDKHTGLLRLDRVLYTSTHYPANYGFIPRTYADDGDPLDVLVLCNMPLYPLTLVQVYPIGVMRMIDGGKLDDKIIALPFSDPTYHDVRDVSELPPHILMRSCTSLPSISSWKTSRRRSRSCLAIRRLSASLSRRSRITDAYSAAPRARRAASPTNKKRQICHGKNELPQIVRTAQKQP